MARLEQRVQEILDEAAANGGDLSDLDVTRRLAPEFSSVCGQTEIRAAVVREMRRRLHARVKAGLDSKGFR